MPNVDVEQSQIETRRLPRYPGGVPVTLEYPSIPAWGFLKRAADNFPDRTACYHYEQKWDYRTLWEDSSRAAAVLKDFGVRPGDRVGLLMPNVPEYIIALHGIWMAGGIAVAISPLMVAEEVSSLLAATECRVVVSLDLLAPLVLGGDVHPDHMLLVTFRDQLPAWEQIGYLLARRKKTGRWRITESQQLRWFNREMSARAPDNDPVQVSSAETPAYILPTGGTTGTPKAVVLSHRNIVANAWQQFHWVGGRMGEETVLAVLPFFHSYGLSTSVMTGMAMAATLILHPRFNARIVLRLIDQHRPTLLPAVPAMLTALNERLRHKSSDLSSIRWCISGGAPLDPAVAEEFAAHSGAQVVEGFGLSEASPVTHVGPLDGTARRGTIGLPLPDTEARIVDVDTGLRELPPGQPGELMIRGPQVMLGYWNDPDETAHSLRDGWLYTGDIAIRDEDGFYRVVDRKKDLIITSGFNVYPAEVEHVLRKLPEVHDAAVIGVPDSRRGETVKAFLVLKNGIRMDRKALQRFCERRLAAHKRPRIFEAVYGDLPRNFLGKVIRRRLRDEAVDVHSRGDGVADGALLEPVAETSE